MANVNNTIWKDSKDDTANNVVAEEQTGLSKETMGQRIKRLRTRNKWNMNEFSALTEVTKPTIYRWEDDQVTPTDKSIETMCKLFGVSEKYLRFGADTGKENMIDLSGLSFREQAYVRALVDLLRDRH